MADERLSTTQPANTWPSLTTSLHTPVIMIDPATLNFLLIGLSILAYIRFVTKQRARTRGLPYPPGPKGLPILGNLFNIPIVNQWRAFQYLSSIHGQSVEELSHVLVHSPFTFRSLT